MKATLIAAAFLIPTLVLANDPSSKTTKDTYGQKGAYGQKTSVQTPSEVLNKIHSLSQKSIEKATVAQTSASNEKVKNFAGKQLKDFQKLDKSVVDLAKDQKITLSAMTGSSAGSHEYGAAGSQGGSMGSAGSMDRETTGTIEHDTTGSGSAGAGSMPPKSGSTAPGSTRSGTATGSGSMGSDTTGSGSSERMGSTTTGSSEELGTTGKTGTDIKTGSTGSGSMGSAAGESMDAMDTRWDRLKNLSGAQFDSEYLSMTADNARRNITVLEGARIKGDRKLDKVIDTAIKTFRDHQDQAEKIQRDIRAS